MTASYKGSSSQGKDLVKVEAALASSILAYQTRAALNLDLNHPPGTVAAVLNDSTPANNALWQKTGDPLSGSWQPTGFAADVPGGGSGAVGMTESTWTPTVGGSQTTGVGTYTTQVGRYTRIGNLVHFQAMVTWTAHTATGAILFYLPLPGTDDVPNFRTCHVTVNNGGSIPVGLFAPTGLIYSYQGFVWIKFQAGSGMGGSLSDVLFSNMPSGTMYIEGHYTAR